MPRDLQVREIQKRNKQANLKRRQHEKMITSASKIARKLRDISKGFIRERRMKRKVESYVKYEA